MTNRLSAMVQSHELPDQTGLDYQSVPDLDTAAISV